jgi:hypothetical protein
MGWKPALWLVVAGSIGAALCVPLAAAASHHSNGPNARAAASAGVTYGGVTPQGWPVVIQFAQNQRRIRQAGIGITTRCTSGDFVDAQDGWVDLPVSTKRKFGATSRPHTYRYDDGTTSDIESSINGALNRTRSKVSGTWRLKITYYDSAGAVTDTCDSGSVRGTAKQ